MYKFEPLKFGLGAVTTDDRELTKAIQNALGDPLALMSYSRKTRDWRLVYQPSSTAMW